MFLGEPDSVNARRGSADEGVESVARSQDETGAAVVIDGDAALPGWRTSRPAQVWLVALRPPSSIVVLAFRSVLFLVVVMVV